MNAVRLIPPLAVAGMLSLACEAMEDPPVFHVEEGDSASSVVHGLVHTVTVDGVLRAHLEADVAHLYERAQIWELVGVTVHFFSAVGERTSTVTSDEGTYNQRTKDMEARGNVVGTTPDGKRLTTSVMRYENLTDELVGPDPFRFTGVEENLTGSSFRADPDFSRVTVTSVSGSPGAVNRR
jgi:LPS export ABC transporter protein LptC